MRRLAVLLALAMLSVLFACGQPAAERSASGGGPPPQPYPSPAVLDDQARQALARWAEAVARHGDQPRFVPIDSGFEVAGDREPEVAENFKLAVSAGQVQAGPGVLPDGEPGSGQVRWTDGEVVTLPLLSAEATLRAFRDANSGDCRGCTPLRVIGARLVDVTVRTDRGPATAPAWEYSLAGTAARITQVAVDRSAAIAVTPLPWPANTPPGVRVDSATVAADGRTVTAHFFGARDGDGPCTSDYTARAAESEHAAVIIVEEHPYPAGKVQPCTAAGFPRTVTAALAAPLGRRTLLDIVGQPVPPTR